MFKKPERYPHQASTPKSESGIPDPWEATAPEPHFPTPLELDRLLREPHPLLDAPEELIEISPAGIPGVELLPTHAASTEMSSVDVLLKNELKLHGCFVEKIKVQSEKALALLYWLATQPDQLLT